MPHRFEVSKPYHADRKTWPECSQLHWMSGELELVMFFDRPSRHEIDAARLGLSEFALYDRDGLVVLLYRFDGPKAAIPWSDASFQWHLVPPDRRVAPPEQFTAESRAKLYITLVNASGGLIEALRIVSLSHEFTVAIFGAIRRQIDLPWTGRPSYDARIDALYRQYPTSEALLVQCSVHSKGGA